MRPEAGKALMSFEAAWDRARGEHAAALRSRMPAAQSEGRLSSERQARTAQKASAEEQERQKAIARMEQRLRARRAEAALREKRLLAEAAWREQLCLPSRPQATSGRGWRVLETPRVPHERLEAHARNVWNFVWHGIDWPAGWRVRWGEMNTRELMSLGDLVREYAGGLVGRTFKPPQCALSSDDRILGLCKPGQKIILIDEANHVSLRRTPKQFAETIIHELIHAHVGSDDGDHGPRFQAALANASLYYFGSTDEPVLAPTGART